MCVNNMSVGFLTRL